MFYDVHAVIVIFGGTRRHPDPLSAFASILHGLPLGDEYAFTMRRMTQRELIDEIASLADIARKQGPLGLEKVEVDDPFLAKGVRYVADGYDANFIRETLTRDRETFLHHLDEGQKIYRAIGDCAPAFGMVGTLIGMVQMFANMTDPSKLGPFMAIALLATLYGAALANLFCLPLADKLQVKLIDEEVNRTLIIDGILMLREAKSPRSCARCCLPICRSTARATPRTTPPRRFRPEERTECRSGGEVMQGVTVGL
jgi:chemotaxis protein MotA